jgi:DNA polymerase-3 subunit epsilon
MGACPEAMPYSLSTKIPIANTEKYLRPSLRYFLSCLFSKKYGSMENDRFIVKEFSIMHKYITIFDFETSGLSPEKDRVIEIAAIRCKGDQVVSEFSTLVQFDGVLSPKIVELTGIQQEDLQHGLSEDTAFRILNRFLTDSLLIAHNAAFDLAFLHNGLMRLANRSFNNSFIDTLTIGRDILYYPYTLKDTCDHYAVTLEGAHRALNDVYGCWEIYKRFSQEVDIDSYINKLGYLKKYGPPKWAPSHAQLVPMENRYRPD